MEPVTLLLVDDHQIFLDGLKMLLQAQPTVTVCGTALNGIAALEILQEKQPDIVITDINMPTMGGIEFTRSARELYPGLKIIALTMLNDYSSIKDMMAAGADAYILKNTSSSEMLRAIEEVMNDGSYVSPEINHILLEGMRFRNDALTIPSERELQVLRFIVNGSSSKQIASEMHISVDTVKFHRKNLLLKLGQPNSASLVRYALERKLV